jgi:tetratricopeptide (TPR) repeat protein
MYDKYHTVRDAREVGYLLMLRHLIDWICEQQIIKEKTDYENLWRVFDENCVGLSKNGDAQEIEEEINVGYHRQRLEHLQQELQFQAVQAQEATKHSPAVAAKMVGVLMESQGENPKLLYHEYGQQFQRPSITPNFIERKSLWDKIVVHFKQSEQQILTLSAHGLGGMGKTELARYYYLYPPRPYTLRAWFNAEDKELLYAQYVDLARANGIEYEKEMPIQEQARQVKNWLETQKDCLLVYDNVPNAKQLEGLLPEQGKHHILITSRNEVGWPAHQKIDIEVMEEDEAMALICKITGCKEATIGLKELVNILGYMPLALAQAGAYIAEKQTSIEDYLNRYRKYQSILMSDGILDLNPRHEPVWITFNMNFKALEEDYPSALTTLKQASWLAVSAIPEILLENMLEATKDEPVDLLWDEVKRHIGRYSLMRIDREGHQLSMHRLLQDILRSKQDESECKGMLNQIALSIKRIYPENDKTMENISMVRLLLPHVETTLSHLKNCFNESECADFNLEYNLGEAYATIGNYVKAKKNLHEDLLIKQKRYKDYQIQVGEDIYIGKHLDMAKSLGNLGKVYYYLGEYQEALKYEQQALKMFKIISPDNHPDRANSLSNLGSVYYDLSKYQKSLKYHQQALKMRESLYPGNHPDKAQSLNNIGLVYKALGQPPEALKYYEQALKMWDSVYTTNKHPDIAVTLENIGSLHQDLGKYPESLNYYQKAFDIRKNIYPDNFSDISLAKSYNNLGRTHQNLGKYEEALENFKNALDIWKANCIDNHPDVAIVLNNMGSYYHDLGDYQKALNYYNQALKIYRAIYSDNYCHSMIALLLDNIGTICYALGEYPGALQYLEQALAMRQALYKGNHLDIATSFNNIGAMYHTLGKHQEALQYLEQALLILVQVYPGDHSEIQTVKGNIAKLKAK